MDVLSVFHYLNELRKQVDRSDSYKRRELDFLSFALKNITVSNAQLMQDLWVLYETDMKRGGYFVEFGACDGVSYSNTLALEKHFGWSGALAEPARTWHNALHNNRLSYISKKCVFGVSGQTIEFNETEYPELSTIDTFSDSDVHAQHRVAGKRYGVESISLADFLTAAQAPNQIDYLSMDTEGSELEIIQGFDFSTRDIKLISVEHNNTDKRDLIFEELSKWGYRRVFSSMSQFDDWYIKQD